MKRGKLNLAIIVLIVFSSLSIVVANDLVVQIPTPPQNVGDNFDVNIIATTTTDIHSIQFDFLYDDSILNLNSVVEGPFLSSDGNTTVFDSGSFEFGLVNNTYIARNTTWQDGGGLTGSGVVATLNFQVAAEGSSNLDLNEIIWINSSILNSSAGIEDPTVINNSVIVAGCDLTSAYWSIPIATSGQLVDLIVEGTNCAGEQINFTIWEDDFLFPHDFMITIEDSYDRTSWNAVYDDEGGIDPDPEYYFVAYVISDPTEQITSSGGNLQVTELINDNSVLIMPRTSSVTQGNWFEVEVRARAPIGSSDIYGLQFDLLYNPSNFILNSITEGDMLSEGGSVDTIFNYTLSAGHLDNVYNIRNITFEGGNVGLYQTDGVIAVLNFTALSPGTKYLNITEVIWANSTIDNQSVGVPGITVENGTVIINPSGNQNPQINSVECYINSAWTDCANFLYADTLREIRANCTDLDLGQPTSANFEIRNIEDNKVIVNGPGVQSGDIWTLDFTDFNLNDSGSMELTVTCSDGVGGINNTVVSWFVPWGQLVSTVTNPPGDLNVSQHNFFLFGGSVTCINGECGNVTVTIDPLYSCGAACQGTNGCTDNSLLACSINHQCDGSNAVNDIYVNSSGGQNVYAGEIINITIDYSCWDNDGVAPWMSEDEITVWYHNGTGWKMVHNQDTSQLGNCDNVADGVDGSLSITLLIDDIEGIHTIRVYETNWDLFWYTENESCASTFQDPSHSNQYPYGDFDDIELTVSAASSKGGPISTTPGDTPFYTTSSNPVTCYDMKEGSGSCVTSWDINATGPVDSSTDYEFYIIYDSNYEFGSNNEQSDSRFITINDTYQEPSYTEYYIFDEQLISGGVFSQGLWQITSAFSYDGPNSTVLPGNGGWNNNDITQFSIPTEPIDWDNGYLEFYVYSTVALGWSQVWLFNAPANGPNLIVDPLHDGSGWVRFQYPLTDFAADAATFGTDIVGFRLGTDSSSTTIFIDEIKIVSPGAGPGDTLPPTFTNLADRYLIEGQSLNYDIDAVDPEGHLDSFRINNTVNFQIDSGSGLMTNITQLSVGTYTIEVIVNDTYSNENTGIFIVNVSPIADTTAPVRSNWQPDGSIFPSGTTQVYINLTTDEIANCKYDNDSGILYSAMSDTFSTTDALFHNQLITGLVDGQSYSYYVKCMDQSNNANSNDILISFTVEVAGPTCTDGDGDLWAAEPDASTCNFDCGTGPGSCIGEGDCNDGDAGINPGATEDCTDGVDNDCNDESDYDNSTADGLKGDIACAVDVFNFGLAVPYTYFPEEYTTFEIICGTDFSGFELNSVNARVESNQCEYMGYGGFGIYQYNCSAGAYIGGANKTVYCELDSSVTYETNPGDETLQINVTEAINCVDNDTDGYYEYDAIDCSSGTDCNDANPNINPGMAENCSNEIDDNCDGDIDLDDATCSPNYDLNNNGQVEIGDLSMAAMVFGSTCSAPSWCGGRDVNHDYTINILDLQLIGMHFT